MSLFLQGIIQNNIFTKQWWFRFRWLILFDDPCQTILTACTSLILPVFQDFLSICWSSTKTRICFKIAVLPGPLLGKTHLWHENLQLFSRESANSFPHSFGDWNYVHFLGTVQLEKQMCLVKKCRAVQNPSLSWFQCPPIGLSFCKTKFSKKLLAFTSRTTFDFWNGENSTCL